MNSCISAVGTANPPYKIAQTDLCNFMTNALRLNDTDAARLKALYDGSGIAYRYSVLPDFLPHGGLNDVFFNNTAITGDFPGTSERLKLYKATAINIALNAVTNCFNRFDYDVGPTITHLITVSCTGMYAPGLDIDLIEKLRLNTSIQRVSINFMGCYGAVNALKTADNICRSDPHARVLVVSVELCTLHFQNANTFDNWISGSLFSDGAAAALIENGSGGTAQGKSLILKEFYCDIFKDGQEDMSWVIGDLGFEMKLTSNISRLISKNIGNLTVRMLKNAGLTFEQFDLFAIHPGGKGILKAVEEALTITAENNHHSYEILRNYGNMSSASILFVLENILRANVQDGQKILSFAFGPGLTIEGMILETCS